MGFKIGEHCFIEYGVWLDFGTPYNIEIGNNVIISYGAKILGHDSSLNNMFDFPIRMGKTVLKDSCYIGAGAIILAGVSIGTHAIVGAGSVVTKDVEPNTVVVGNPARFLKTTDQFLSESRERFNANPQNFMKYNSEYRKV
jgi:acetyltransferase-like isoleucine patch superfamily enzyme